MATFRTGPEPGDYDQSGLIPGWPGIAALHAPRRRRPADDSWADDYDPTDVPEVNYEPRWMS